MSKKFDLAGLEVELEPGVHLSTERKRRPSCYILDTGDRISALLGAPAQKFYLDLVKQYEEWQHSPEEICESIFHHEYVYPAQVMIWRSSLEIPTEGVITPPSEFQETINPDVFIEVMRTEALDIWEHLMLDLPELRRQKPRVVYGGLVEKVLGVERARWRSRTAETYLPLLRRLRVLELYLTYDQIQAIEALIHEYMYDIFDQKYYL